MFWTKLKVSGDGTHIACVREQPERIALLETVKAIRNGGTSPEDRDGLGRWALSIPFEDWLRVRERYPDLASNDAKVKTRAYLRFMRSAESLPFRVREKI